jgi:signal transduction histidine kinase
MYDSFTSVAEVKGLQFILKDKLPDGNLLINTDKEKVHSILTNFIKNAIKFSHSGEVEVGSFLEDDKLFIYVKDMGIGIPKKVQKVIFNRFVQADLSFTRPYEGSGLGLAIAKAYAELLDGKIWLESEEGKGSTFWFSISLKLSII